MRRRLLAELASERRAHRALRRKCEALQVAYQIVCEQNRRHGC